MADELSQRVPAEASQARNAPGPQYGLVGQAKGDSEAAPQASVCKASYRHCDHRSWSIGAKEALRKIGPFVPGRHYLELARVGPQPAVPDVFAIGIDLGARIVHVVVLDDSGSVQLAESVPAPDLAIVLPSISSEAVVAIDAPDAQQVPRHLGDVALSPKFRPARCGEIALGSLRHYWVPWVTPPRGSPCEPWMITGFGVWRSVRQRGLRAIEVYPHAAFLELSGGFRLGRKTTAEGRRQRSDLLEAAGVDLQGLDVTSHDTLDAAAAAVVARDARLGTADEVSCHHGDGTDSDGSAIWLPQRRSQLLARKDTTPWPSGE
ncbi:MAG: DUF429 domain-containing protein [Acidimicrobiales bacterium]